MTVSTVGALVRERALSHADEVFLVCDDERITYGELAASSEDVARELLALGVTRGTHVGMLMPNGTAFASSAAALARIGAVAVPFATLSTAAELRGLITGSDIEVLLAVSQYRGNSFRDMVEAAIGPNETPVLRYVRWQDDPPAVDPVSLDFLAAAEAQVVPSDVLVIVHTSGSTSAPKGVVHTQGALLDHLVVLNELRAYGDGDVLFSNSPFFWIGGFAYTFLGTLVAGARLVCSAAADPARVLDVLERERPTMVNGYASSAVAMAADPSFASRDLTSITRGNLYPIMPAHTHPADPALRTNMLGMTEGGSVVLTATDAEANVDLPQARRGSFGRPTPDLQARIVDSGGQDMAVGALGELWLRGAPMMQGYYGRERFETFDADGWFHTNDVFHVDEAGHWYFHGRDDDMIKTAGANVAPAEVQDAIRNATGLSSLVLGVPDPLRGAVVAVVLLAEPGVVVPEEAELRERLAPLLSSYKIPRMVARLTPSDVPLKSSGKVDHAALKELFA
jgi:acyl-CoA synthetase (AMP-forming)/AMP-acid ligase II